MNLRIVIPALAVLSGALAIEAAAQDFRPVLPAPGQVADTPGTGAYPAIKTVADGLPGYVVYLPQDLTRLGDRKLGVYLFANGGCEADGTKSRLHLLEIASHGYVAISPGGVHSGPGASPKPARPAPDLGAGFVPETPIDVLESPLDWVLRENEREGSPLSGRIDPAQIASSGYSCGGLQALHLRSDPRVKTYVMMYSGLFPDGSDRLGGMAPAKAELGKLKGSILYVLGGPEDIAYANGMDDVRRIDHIPAVAVNLPVGHGGTYDQANGGKAAQVTVSWLNWRLRGDDQAGAQFRGADCGLCTSSEVTIQTKNLD